MYGGHICLRKQGLGDASILDAVLAEERSTMSSCPILKEQMGQGRSNNGGLNTYSSYAMIGLLRMGQPRVAHVAYQRRGPCMLIDREEKEVHSDTHCEANVQHGIRRLKGSKSMCQRAKRESRSRSPKRSARCHKVPSQRRQYYQGQP